MRIKKKKILNESSRNALLQKNLGAYVGPYIVFVSDVKETFCGQPFRLRFCYPLSLVLIPVAELVVECESAMKEISYAL